MLGARRGASRSGSRGEGSKEWRQEVGWSTGLKNLRGSCSLRSAKVGIFATYSAEVYGISFASEKMIRIARFWIASILSA